ncbi:unnamed protein product [Echinostoma caproni]|uniref:DSBA domain-containing protein n=1 Tax=Echinostoma caproni TaxID=27848 RepID=A0A183AN35_9TREM|nr:unnamed protein product [Echinostoma caproni]
MNVPEDYTFGLPNHSGDLTAGQLLHGRIPREIAGLPFESRKNTRETENKEHSCVDTKDQRTMLLPIVHHALRKAQFWRGPEITTALCHRANGADLISMTEARALFYHFEVPLDEELTELMFDAVAVVAPPKMIETVRKQQLERIPSNVILEKVQPDSEWIEWAVDWRLMAAFLDWKRQTDSVEQIKLKNCGCAWEKPQKPERFEREL